MAQYGWHKGDDGDWDWSYYGDSEEPYLRTGWFQAVPDSEMHSSAHDDGSVYWYYSTSAGKTAVSEFRTIDGKTYAFNEYGELVTGLKKVKVDSSDKKKIESISSIDYISDIENVEENVYVCYFGGDGAAKTGTQTLTIDGSSYTFDFKSSGSPKGAGTNGINDNYIYVNGRRLAAEEDSKYGIVEYDGKRYLVNESGAIQKNKKNVKDADGYYYCTGKHGIVVHEHLEEKCTDKEHPEE